MATAVLVDASVATRGEWLSVVTDYIGPQLNYVSGKFLDHQVRNAGSPNTHCLPISCAGPSASNRFRHVWVTIYTPKSHPLQAIL